MSRRESKFDLQSGCLKLLAIGLLFPIVAGVVTLLVEYRSGLFVERSTEAITETRPKSHAEGISPTVGMSLDTTREGPPIASKETIVGAWESSGVVTLRIDFYAGGTFESRADGAIGGFLAPDLLGGLAGLSFEAEGKYIVTQEGMVKFDSKKKLPDLTIARSNDAIYLLEETRGWTFRRNH